MNPYQYSGLYPVLKIKDMQNKFKGLKYNLVILISIGVCKNMLGNTTNSNIHFL